MRNIKIYILLTLLLLGATALYRWEAWRPSGTVEVSEAPEIAPGWLQTAAGEVNRSGVELVADGINITDKRSPLLLTEQMEWLLPVSMVTKAFSCTVNYYDGFGFLLEQGDRQVRIVPGDSHMTVNGQSIELSQPAVEADGSLYLPLEAVAGAFAYGVEWMPEEMTIRITSLEENRKILPSAYDYRKLGKVQRVKNQGSLGTCWAFASLMALETTLMPEEILDFSEDHMSLRNSSGYTQDEGGDYTMSMAYLLAWQGPVFSEEDPYGDGYSPEGLTAKKHVQEIQILTAKDYQKIKEGVYFHGGVQSSLYTILTGDKSQSEYYDRENNSYCYTGTEKPNHDVVIIGWDDQYPKENFSVLPEGDGAFICINSWGDDFGDEGYFYVSYYDTNIGIYNILYTAVEDKENYGNIYQSDLCGWVGQMGYGYEHAYFANVYETKAEEDLAAVGFYATGENTGYRVYVVRHVTDGDSLVNRVLAAEGTFVNAGFYTVPLDVPVELDAGERFGVVVEITTPGAVHPIAIEYDADSGSGPVDLSDGEGYISLKGNTWERVEETQQSNICLKAYTSER